MDALLIYLLKVTFIQIFLVALYGFLLKKETFYWINRLYLLLTLAASLILPILPFPQVVSAATPTAFPAYSPPISAAYYDAVVQPLQTTITFARAQQEPVKISVVIYWSVVSLLTIHFIVQLLSVVHIIHKSEFYRSAGYQLVKNKRTKSPFSFFRYIIIPAHPYENQTFEHVLTHEQMHVRQWHTLDILLAELYTVFFWFNPFAWWHKKAIRLNLEYLADKGVLDTGTSAHHYQTNLLKIHLVQPGFTLTNHFNTSFIKNRIHMMNSKASPELAKWKYLLTIPLVCGLAMLVNLTKAEEVENNLTTLSGNLSAVVQKSTGYTSKQGNTRTITGLVKDAETDKPIPQAHVKVQGKTTEAKTDAQGRFSIEVGQQDKALVIAAFPYDTAAMAITSSSEMTVLLRVNALANRLRYGPNGIFYGGAIISNFGEVIRLSSPVRMFYSPKPLPDSVMYLINGKRVNKEAILALDSKHIDQVMIYKRYEAEQRYGKGAGPGVVDVYLKK